VGQVIATFPGQADTVQAVTLDGTQFLLRLYWRDRLAAWYLDLSELDETPVLLGRRLSTGWAPLAGVKVENRPDGYLFVRGPAEYVRGQLGVDVHLSYYSRDEVSRGIVPEFAVTVTHP
jgi:uncharacterized protein YigE (DUF2233 family)